MPKIFFSIFVSNLFISFAFLCCFLSLVSFINIILPLLPACFGWSVVVDCFLLFILFCFVLFSPAVSILRLIMTILRGLSGEYIHKKNT
jgi:hypothetical protein